MAKNLLKYCTSKSLYELDGEKQKKSGMAYIHLIPDFYDFQVRDVRNLELVRPLHLTCKFRCVAMERLVWWPQDLGLKILSSRTEREREKSQLHFPSSRDQTDPRSGYFSWVAAILYFPFCSPYIDKTIVFMVFSS